MADGKMSNYDRHMWIFFFFYCLCGVRQGYGILAGMVKSTAHQKTRRRSLRRNSTAEYKLGGSTRALCGGHHIGGEGPYLEWYAHLVCYWCSSPLRQLHNWCAPLRNMRHMMCTIKCEAKVTTKAVMWHDTMIVNHQWFWWMGGGGVTR